MINIHKSDGKLSVYIEINNVLFNSCIKDIGQPYIVSESLKNIIYSIANRFIYSNMAYLKEFYSWVVCKKYYNKDRIKSYIDMIPKDFNLLIQYRNDKRCEEIVEVTKENFESIPKITGLNDIQYAILRSSTGNIILELRVATNYMCAKLSDGTDKIYGSSNYVELLIKNLCDNIV